MKLKATNFYTALFALVVFLQLYLPSFKTNIFIQIAVLAVYFFFEKPTISIKFFKEITPLLLLFLIGFIGAILYQNKLYTISKDIFHFLKPITGILVGYYLFKKINNFKIFIKTIVLVAFLSAIIHLFAVLFFSKASTVSDLREFSKDNYLELIALFFMIFYKKFQKENLFYKPLNHKIILAILLISCVLYFSRTMIIVAIIIITSLYSYTIITKKTLKIAAVLVLSTIALYIYLFSIKINKNGNSLDSFLYKIKIAPEEVFKTKINRENHNDLWDHWRAYEALRAIELMKSQPSSFVFGTGHGSLVNLKFFAPLSGGKNDKGLKYISELHNGYMYIFYKTGILGMLIYLSFYFKLYKRIYQNRNFITLFISAFGLVFIFTTLTITGVYNTRDVMIIILGALLFFENKKISNNENQTC